MPLKPCKKDQVRSPISNRCVKVGGPAYKKAFPGKNKGKSPKKYPRKRAPTKKSKVYKPCEKGKVRSPISNRCVKVGGPAYKKAFPKGKSPKKSPKGTPSEYDINTDLIEACEYGDLELVQDVIKLGADISTKDNLPLLMASKNGHFEIVKYLVENGANVSARGNDAFIWACGGGHLSTAKYLISKGADPFSQKNDALILACENGHISIIDYLISLGIDIRANNDEAIIMAANNGQLNIVKHLVSLGADPHAQNDKAMEYAKSEGHMNVVNYLKSLNNSKEKIPKKKGDCISRSKVPLKPYQKSVVEHLNNHRGLLAIHGIGTGKTLTGVTASVCFLNKNPDSRVTVISPAGLIANFKKGMEIYGISPDDSRYSFYSFELFSRKLGKIKIGDTMASLVNKLNKEIDADCSDNMLIVDEAHKLRTPIANNAKGGSTHATIGGVISLAVLKCAIQAKKVLLLTATPFVNDISDLNNLVAMVKGKLPLSKMDWTRLFASKTERGRYLKNVISVYFREENDPNYPKRIDKNIDIEMSEKFLKEYLKLEAGQSGYSGSNVWAFMSGMRTGLLKMKIDDKNKILYVVDLVKEKNAQGKKVVVYSNFIESGVNEIQRDLNDIGIRSEIFSGETKDSDRKKFVSEYNSDNLKVLLLSSAGGAGLDLKGTNAIVILDPPWNEANLEQAIGRAIRYESHAHLPDKERYVEVYQLFNVKPKGAPGEELSVDSMIKGLIDKKKKLTKNVVSALRNVSINDTSDELVDEKLWEVKPEKEKKEKTGGSKGRKRSKRRKSRKSSKKTRKSKPRKNSKGKKEKTLKEKQTFWRKNDIFSLIYRGDLEGIKYLVSLGADLNERNGFSIVWASKNGELAIVKYLVKQGIDIRSENNSAIKAAKKNGHEDVVEYLISQGAKL